MSIQAKQASDGLADQFIRSETTPCSAAQTSGQAERVVVRGDHTGPWTAPNGADQCLDRGSRARGGRPDIVPEGVWLTLAQSPRQAAARLYSRRTPTKPIAALDPPDRQWDHVGRPTGSALLDPLVWPGVIVVIDVLS